MRFEISAAVCGRTRMCTSTKHSLRKTTKNAITFEVSMRACVYCAAALKAMLSFAVYNNVCSDFAKMKCFTSIWGASSHRPEEYVCNSLYQVCTQYLKASMWVACFLLLLSSQMFKSWMICQMSRFVTCWQILCYFVSKMCHNNSQQFFFTCTLRNSK